MSFLSNIDLVQAVPTVLPVCVNALNDLDDPGDKTIAIWGAGGASIGAGIGAIPGVGIGAPVGASIGGGAGVSVGAIIKEVKERNSRKEATLEEEMQSKIDSILETEAQSEEIFSEMLEKSREIDSIVNKSKKHFSSESLERIHAYKSRSLEAWIARSRDNI